MNTTTQRQTIGHSDRGNHGDVTGGLERRVEQLEDPGGGRARRNGGRVGRMPESVDQGGELT